jgi:hypothetical protein
MPNMPWKLVRVRKSGRIPLNGRNCMICEKKIGEEEAWSNRNKHRSKLVCKICFTKMWA